MGGGGREWRMKLSYAVIFHIFPPPGIDSATYSMNFKFEYKFTKKYELFFSCFFFSFELFELRKQKNIHMLDCSLRHRKAESRFNFLKKMGRKRRIESELGCYARSNGVFYLYVSHRWKIISKGNLTVTGGHGIDSFETKIEL